MRNLDSKSKKRYFLKPKLSKLLSEYLAPPSVRGLPGPSIVIIRLWLLLLPEGQLGEVETGFLANQSFLLSMKYIDHWMKGKYEWTENHEKRFIYLWNSRARVRHGRSSARRFQTAYAFFTHSCNFPSENKGLPQGITRFSVTSF